MAALLSWIVVVGLQPTAATVRLPDVGQLKAAVDSGDEVEIERVAARLGAVRLGRIAERGERDQRLSALKALGLVGDGWAVLPLLAKLVGDKDAGVAEAAANAAQRIAEALTPEAAELDDVPRDVPQRAARALLEQARRQEVPRAVRVVAIAAAAALRPVARLDESALEKLLGDADQAVRRVTAEALAGTGALSEKAARALEATLAGDAAAEVAAAAAAALCRDVPPTAMPKSPAEQRAAKLPQAARERLRALALNDALPLGDRLELVGCLRVQPQAEDQKVLDALARRPPESLKRRARALGGR